MSSVYSVCIQGYVRIGECDILYEKEFDCLEARNSKEAETMAITRCLEDGAFRLSVVWSYPVLND